MERVSSKLSLASLGSEKRAGGRAQPIKSLSEEVSEGGVNFSVGQRQLLVIARAMLTGASIVIMDEATASVDADTDARIQRVFRSEFKNATCITVAHRLNTIMDSDLVLVMDDGKVNTWCDINIFKCTVNFIDVTHLVSCRCLLLQYLVRRQNLTSHHICYRKRMGSSNPL